MADVPASLYSWSTTTGSNSPSSTTSIGAGLAPNLQEIQGAVRRALAYKGADIASSSTTDLGAVDGLMHNITGTATITSFGTVAAGVWKVICFQGTPAITYNGTSMITPGGISITAAVNDIAIVQSLGSGNWRFVSYTKASGLPVANPTVTGPFTDASGITKNASDATKIWRPRAENLTTATTRNGWLVDEDSVIGTGWLSPNMTVTVTAAANAMTIAWKDKAGADFSATNPLSCKFRASTSTAGTYTALTVTGAFSITIAASSTLGTVSSQAHRIYFGRANNSGTVVPWVYNPVSGVNHLPCRSHALVNATLNSSANSAQTFYSSSALTSVPIIIDGYFESSQTTAGTWASSPTYVHLFRPGDPQSGDLVQRARTSDSSVASSPLAITFDDTIPQIGEGSQILTTSFTPRHSCDLLHVYSNVVWDAAGAETVSYALFNGASNALTATHTDSNGSSSGRTSWLDYVYVANTASAITFSTRLGTNGGATQITVNGRASARKLGGVENTYIEIQEVFA